MLIIQKGVEAYAAEESKHKHHKLVKRSGSGNLNSAISGDSGHNAGS
jgi:hypothetical protein